jgi:nanoRNase/pAp phosphatase (c-di-AMP/oligoRNAs hydrolase)
LAKELLEAKDNLIKIIDEQAGKKDSHPLGSIAQLFSIAVPTDGDLDSPVKFDLMELQDAIIFISNLANQADLVQAATEVVQEKIADLQVKATSETVTEEEITAAVGPAVTSLVNSMVDITTSFIEKPTGGHIFAGGLNIFGNALKGFTNHVQKVVDDQLNEKNK